MARQNKQWKESGVRLGHSPTYIMWDYILPPQNLWSCPSLHLRFPSFLKCRPFLLWKISPAHVFLFHFAQGLVLPSLLIPLHSRVSAIVLQTCSTISPNTQKHTLALHISLQLLLHFSNTFQKKQLHELWFHVLICLVQSSSSLVFSPLLYCSSRAISAWCLCWHVQGALFTSHPGRAQLHWPHWPVLPAGNALRFASVPTQTSFPQSLLTSVIFTCSSSSPTLVQELLTSWSLPFLSPNTHSNDSTYCLNFKYYSYAFPSLYL